MKNSEFERETVEWLDRFISAHDRDPIAYWEFIQFVMDTLVDEGQL